MKEQRKSWNMKRLNQQEVTEVYNNWAKRYNKLLIWAKANQAHEKFDKAKLIMFALNDRIKAMLDVIWRLSDTKENEKCPCGSGRNFSECHMNTNITIA